jgi:hypothetical protein
MGHNYEICICTLFILHLKIRNRHGSQQPSNLTGGQICRGRVFLQYKQLSTKQIEYFV